MTEALWLLATPSHALLDAISFGGLPELTAADLALACAGLGRHAHAAALYSWAGDDSQRSTLKAALLEHLLAERERCGWAHRVERMDGTRGHFAEPLVELYLAEERRPCVCQSAPQIRALAIGVEPEEWRQRVSHQWMAVASEYQRWLVDAGEHVRRRMRGY